MTIPASEAERVRDVYARRERLGLDARYDYWQPANLFIYQSRERALLRLLRARLPLTGLRVLDAGCGDGAVLRDLQRCGARPQDLYGVDLLPERIERARCDVPGAHFELGDVQTLPFEDRSFDLTLAFTLLSSALDGSVRARLCREMRRVTRSGGLVVVYDFWVNPFNRDARPLGRRELPQLFDGHQIDFEGTTLAPPLVRLLAPLPGGTLACTALEMVPFARTHFLAAVHI